jgi:hypothetical protein
MTAYDLINISHKINNILFDWTCNVELTSNSVTNDYDTNAYINYKFVNQSNLLSDSSLNCKHLINYGGQYANDSNFNALVLINSNYALIPTDDWNSYSNLTLTTWFKIIDNQNHSFFNDTTNMELWHKFDNGNANLTLDSSGKGRNATNYSGTWNDTIYEIGNGSIYFNGVSQYLELNSAMNPYTISNANSITFALWFNISTLSVTSSRLFAFADGSVGGAVTNCSIYVSKNSANTLRFGINTPVLGNSITWDTYVPYTDGTWHHLVWSISSTGTWTIYIDNILQVLSGANATGTLSGALPKAIPSGITWTKRWIAREESGTIYTTGYVDDFRIYNRVLSIPEINILYTAGQYSIKLLEFGNTFYYDTSNLIGWYQFNTNRNNALLDSSSNGNHLTNNNAIFDTMNYRTGNGSFYFNGSSQYLDLPATINPFNIWNSGSGITFACWFKFSTSSGIWARIFDFSDGAIGSTASNWIVVYKVSTGTNIGFGLNISGIFNAFQTTSSYIDNNWHHIVWSISSLGIWSIWIDSIPQVLSGTGANGTLSGTYPRIIPNATWTKRYIGRSGNGTTDGWFIGNIDDFRIYNKVLTDFEVNTLFTMGDNIVLKKENNLISFQINNIPVYETSYTDSGWNHIIWNLANNSSNQGYIEINNTTKTYFNKIPLAPESRQFPPYPMTNHENTFFGYTYRACASGISSSLWAWQAFDRNSTTRFAETGSYNVNGILTVTGVSFGNDTNYKGSYLGIDMGQSIILDYYLIIQSPSLPNRRPKNWKIYATNNDACWNPTGGTSSTPCFNTGPEYGWVQIDVRYDETTYLNTTNFYVNKTLPYRYFAINANMLIGMASDPGGYVFDISEWQIFGYNPMQIIQQYPPAPMTAFSTTIAGITYRACSYDYYAGTTELGYAWKAFDRSGTATTRYISLADFDTNGILNITGTYLGNDIFYKGVYLGIDMGQSFILKYYYIVIYSTLSGRLPRNWKIYATNDSRCWNTTGGTSSTPCFNTDAAFGWTQLDVRSQEIYYTQNTRFSMDSNNTPYRYYALHVNALIGTSASYFDISEWQIFGYPYYVYMNSLGSFKNSGTLYISDFRIHTTQISSYEEDKTYGIVDTVNTNGVYTLDYTNSIILPPGDILPFTSTYWNTSNDFTIAGWFKTESLQNGDILYEIKETDTVTLVNTTNNHVVPNNLTTMSFNYGTPTSITAGTYNVTFSTGNISISTVTDKSFPILKNSSGFTISPLVWYQFNTGTLTLDNGLSCINLSLVGTGGAENTSTFVKGNSSVYFANNANYFRTAMSSINKNVPLSIAFWFRIPVAFQNTYMTMASYTNSAYSSPCIQFDYTGNTTGNLYKILIPVALDTKWSVLIYSSALNMDTWYHLVLTLDDSNPVTARMYIDGALSTSASGTAHKVLPITDLGYIVIGYSGDAGRGYGGFIDDFRFYDFALTSAQVLELYKGRVDFFNTRSLKLIKDSNQLSFQVNNTSLYNVTVEDNTWNHMIWNVASTLTHQGFIKINTTKVLVTESLPNLPLLRYPPAAMTGPITSFTGYGYNTYNSGVYIVSASSVNSPIEMHYNAFNYDNSTNATTNWLTISSTAYSASTGAYIGTMSTNVSGSIVLGEWLQIQLPIPIILNNYNIYTAGTDLTRGPKEFRIAGSNDGITWTSVDYQTNVTSYTSSGKSFTISNMNAYTYYRIIVMANNNNSLVTISEWEIYGHPLFMYANRLGSITNKGKIFFSDFKIITSNITQTLENQLYNTIPDNGIYYDENIRNNNIQLTSNQIRLYNANYSKLYPYVHYEFKDQQLLVADSSSNVRTLNNVGGTYMYDYGKNSILFKRNTEAYIQNDSWNQYSNLSLSTWFKTDTFINNDKIIDFYQESSSYIQVEQYVKYPKEAMTSDTFTSTTTGIVTRCKSTTIDSSSFSVYMLFNNNYLDNTAETRMFHSSLVYNTATGTTTNTYFAGYAGESVLIDLGANIVLKQVRFYPRNNLLMRCPGIFRIYATNDTTKFDTLNYSGWNIIHDQTTLLNTSSYTYGQPTIININNNTFYRVYALVVNTLSGTGTNANYLNFFEWELYGKEVTYVTPPLLPTQISGGDYYYTFANSNITYDVTFLQNTNCQLFMIAGGGGAGYNHGGGGGAGAYYYSSNYTFAPGTYRFMIGAGGAGEINTGTHQAMNGIDTVITKNSVDIFRCKGGGYGGSFANNTSTFFTGGAGGCGGGGLGWDNNSSGSRTYAGGSTNNIGTPGTGFAGGSSVHNFSAGNLSGGGGGGIGGIGQNSFLNASTGRYEGGNGGSALITNMKGFEEVYGGGGGGGEWPANSADPAGLGGGATLSNGIFLRVGGSAVRAEGAAGGNGIVNTGSGGGSGKGGKGGDGGSGVIILRFHAGMKVVENSSNQLSLYLNNKIYFNTINILDNQWNHLVWNITNHGSQEGFVRFNNTQKTSTNISNTLQKYPRAAAIADTYLYTDTTYVRCSGSTRFNTTDHSWFNSFNNSFTDSGWGSASAAYNTSTGVAVNTYRTGYAGEYIQIDLGELIVVKSFNIYARSTTSATLTRAPRDFRLYASNDIDAWANINHPSWTLLDDEINTSTYTSYTPKTFAINNNSAYQLYAIIINKIFSTSAESMCQFAEIEFYAFPETASLNNLIKFPRFPATANTYTYSNSTTIVINGSTRWYNADAATMDTHNYYRSFNYSMIDAGWGSAENTYNTTTGVAINTYRSGYAGEYIQIDLGESMAVKAYKMHPRSDIVGGVSRAPKDFRLYASDDPNAWTNINHSSWTLIDEEINTSSYTLYTPKSFIVNNNVMYRYYVFIINQIFPNNTAQGMCQIAEIELYGLIFFSYINKLGSAANVGDLYLSDFRISTSTMTSNIEDSIYFGKPEYTILVDQEYVKDSIKNVSALYYQNAERIEATATGVAVRGSVGVTGSVLSSYSDMRLKQIVSKIEDPIEKIMQISAFKYTPNDLALTYTAQNNSSNIVNIGISAQDVQTVLPEIVSLAPFDRHTLESGEVISKSGQNYLTVSYQNMVPLLIECIKELNKEIDTLLLK